MKKDNAIVKKKGTVELDDFQLDLSNAVLEQLDELGQSALEVMTSGGKSYIAAHIMKEYASKHRGGKILWFAPISAIGNVKNKIFSKLFIGNRIEYIGYEELSRGGYKLKSRAGSVKLVVFDECHKAYAKKTNQYLNEILSKVPNADRLAMSATPTRYNGLNTFDVLVPKVDEPIQFSLEMAAQHDLLPPVKYVMANMSISEKDIKALERYKSLTAKSEEAKEIYEGVAKTFTDFKFDLRSDLNELLSKFVGSTGESGERHIAFFSSIDVLNAMKDGVCKAFELAYPKCKINMLSYHSGLTDAENSLAFQQFVVDEPEPNRIDVLMSVDKATESIHPDNVRSVLMFRGTASVRVYLQQLGRGIMLKSYHPEDIVIFDFADNVDCLAGRRAPSSGANAPGNALAEAKRALMEQFGYSRGIEAKIGLWRIEQALSRLDTINSMINMQKVILSIDKAKRVYEGLVKRGERNATDNIYKIIYALVEEVELETIKLSSIWKKDKESFVEHWGNVVKYFERYQRAYINNPEQLDETSKAFFDGLGHSAYLNYASGELTKQMLDDIDYIADNIKKYGSVQEMDNNHAKSKLRKLRISFAKDELSNGVISYAGVKGVDIGFGDNIVKSLTGICETEQEKAIVSRLKKIERLLEVQNNKYNCGEEIEIDKWFELTAKMSIVEYALSNEKIASIGLKYIREKYEQVLCYYTMTSYEETAGSNLIAINSSIETGGSVPRHLEDYLFENYEYSGLCEYAKVVLKELGVNGAGYRELINQTRFMRLYRSAVEGDTDSLKDILEYVGTVGDKHRAEMMDSAEIRAMQRNLPAELKNVLLIKKANLMYRIDYDYTELIEELNSALRNGELFEKDIAVIPFMEHEKTDVINMLECADDDFELQCENLSLVGPLSKVVSICEQSTRCCKEVINNILKIEALSDKFKYRFTEVLNFIR